MKIIRGRPPNFDEIARVLPQARNANTIFTYGDTIYTSHPEGMTPSLIAHEAIHIKQQGADPAGWWKRYLIDPEFRFEQELEAHIKEYQVLTQTSNRQVRRRAIHEISKRLAGALYGNVVNRAQAKALIKAGKTECILHPTRLNAG